MGGVRVPGAPEPLYVAVRAVANQVLPSAGLTDLTLRPAAEADTGGFYDPGQPDRITVPKAGLLFCSLMCLWQINALAAGAYAELQAFTSFMPSDPGQSATVSADYRQVLLSLSFSWPAAAGDSVRLRAMQANAGAADATLAAASISAVLVPF